MNSPACSLPSYEGGTSINVTEEKLRLTWCYSLVCVIALLRAKDATLRCQVGLKQQATLGPWCSTVTTLVAPCQS